MLSSNQNNQGSRTKQRPFSAASAHSHRKEYRLPDNESLNSIRNNIHETFSNQNRYLKQVRNLTSTIDKKYGKRIERMCVQYSICQNPIRKKNTFQDIDVEFITRKYIDSKSKQKKKEQQRQLLKKEVGKVSRRYIKKETKQFFKFDTDALRDMEHRAKAESSRRRYIHHPYITIYQKSQVQALNCLTERNQLNLNQINSYPAMAEPDDWEKEHKQIKGIYQGVRSLRRDRPQPPMYRQDAGRDNFYIT